MSVEEQTLHSADGKMYSDFYTRRGQKLTIPDRIVTKLAFLMAKAGSVTGDVTFIIRKISDDSPIVSKVWGDAGSLPTDLTWEEVEFDIPENINEEVRILVEWAGVGDFGTNYVNARRYGANIKEGEVYTEYDPPSYYDRDTYEATYRYTYVSVLSVSIQAMDITIAHGTIEALGETPCTQHGHCWATSPTPTIEDNKTELGAVASAPHAFESTLTDLLPNNTYYVRAYATDGGGTVYSTEISFSTWVGADSINRATDLGNDEANIRWLIELSNPAFDNGHIIEVCAYLTAAASGYTGYLGTFYETDGGVFSSRDCVEVAFPSSGGLKTWKNLSLSIRRGDYIAIGLPIAATGTFGVDIDAAGGVGIKHGDFPGVSCPVINEPFAEYVAAIMSLKGLFGARMSGLNPALMEVLGY